MHGERQAEGPYVAILGFRLRGVVVVRCAVGSLVVEQRAVRLAVLGLDDVKVAPLGVVVPATDMLRQNSKGHIEHSIIVPTSYPELKAGETAGGPQNKRRREEETHGRCLRSACIPRTCAVLLRYPNNDERDQQLTKDRRRRSFAV